MPQGGFGGGGMNGNGANNGNGQRNGGQRNMSKDEQDRNLFDAQSSTLFAYLIEKLGIDKVRQLVDKSREGMESREFITRDDVLGSDFVKIDEKWAEYAKTIKAPSPPQFRAVQAP
jgi:hypothetical protein